MLSIEDVEKIMDETSDAIEYQKVHFTFHNLTCRFSLSSFRPQ